MRMMIIARVDPALFNAAIADGTAAAKIQKVLETLKPEAAYFGIRRGYRTAFMVVDMPDSSALPKFAEPFFLLFNSEVDCLPIMNPADLAKGDMHGEAKKWL